MAAWMILTVRTRQRAIVHAGALIVNQADALFIVPGVLLIFLKGDGARSGVWRRQSVRRITGWQPIRLSLPMNLRRHQCICRRNEALSFWRS